MAEPIVLTDFHAPELDVFARLTEAQLRNRLEPEKGVFIAESPKVIFQALSAGCEPVALLMEERHLTGQGGAVIARCPGVPVYTGDRALLAQLTGYTLTRGILCAMRRPKQADVAELCQNARRLAVLEGVVDATNIGAIFRSAAALDVDAVLLAPNCCDPLNRRAVRVSMGTVFQVGWSWLEDWPGALGTLKAMGFFTAAMALCPEAVALDDPCLQGIDRLAIVLGAEGDGLSEGAISGCNAAVRIPMSHGVDSLNVAAASAVAFWQFRPSL